MNLKIENARGQCYDGVSKSVVASQLKLLNGKFLFTHCYGHVLNLAVGDDIQNLKELKEMFRTAYKLCKIVEKLPKGSTRLDQIQNSRKNESKGIHNLCPTRWTVRGDVLAAFIDNHTELIDLWNWSFQATSDTEMKASLEGVKAFMSTFEFFFSCPLGKIILK